MTKEEFNSLPIEARNFIQNHAGCLSCGNAEAKLTRGYNLYLNHKKMSTYTIFGGGVNYIKGNETGVLRAIKDTDSPQEVIAKIEIAKAVYAEAPHLFSHYDVEAMDKLVADLPAPEVVNISGVFDLKTASYEQMKEFAKANSIEAKSQSKKDLTEAIEAFEAAQLQ